MRTETHRGWLHAEAIEYLVAKGYEYRDFSPQLGVYRYRGPGGARATIEPLPPSGRCVLSIIREHGDQLMTRYYEIDDGERREIEDLAVYAGDIVYDGGTKPSEIIKTCPTCDDDGERCDTCANTGTVDAMPDLERAIEAAEEHRATYGDHNMTPPEEL